MRGHVEVRRSVYIVADPEKFIADIRKAMEGLEKPTLDTPWDSSGEVEIRGWRPMTPIEKAKARRKAKSAAAARQKKLQKQRESEQKELLRLAEKYPDLVKGAK